MHHLPLNPSRSLHQWIVAPYRQDRKASWAGAERLVFEVDCHRNHGSPYAGAGELVRRLVPDAHRRLPALVLRHLLTLLPISPDLQEVVPVSDDVIKSLTFSREGNSRLFTLRLAHGLVDFLLEYFAGTNALPGRISLENVDDADPLDQELIAVLLRRADPNELLVTVGTGFDQVPEPLLAALEARARLIAPRPPAAGFLPGLPDPWLERFREEAAGWRAEQALWHELAAALDLSRIPLPDRNDLDCVSRLVARLPPSVHRSLAEEYVESNCTSHHLLAKRAYDGLDPSLRRELHRARAATLEGSHRRLLALGALPFHHEIAGTGLDPLLEASTACLGMGFYAASLDFAHRAAGLLGPNKGGPEYGSAGRAIVFSLLLLGRLEDVESACHQFLSHSDDPALAAHCAYAMAIMHARFHTGEKRDYEKAAVWLLRALRYTTLVPKSESRVVNEVFLSNTQALIEMRTGRPREALRLLSAGLERLERDAPASLEAESIILLRNRARVHVALGQTEAALANYTALLAREPSNSEAHLDRGLIYQRLGRLEQALQDYDLAIAWSPPYDEVYFNRAQTLSALGRKDEALSDYRYVLDLQPDHVGALLNRAGLLYERQDYAAAREDVHRALALSPSDARVLCLLGLLQMQEGRLNEAYRSFSTAMAEDRSLASPWINRATLLAANGNPEAALRDLDRALGLDDDVTAFYNRGRILQAQGRWPEASADYSRALDLAPGDARHILAERDLCDRAMRPG